MKRAQQVFNAFKAIQLIQSSEKKMNKSSLILSLQRQRLVSKKRLSKQLFNIAQHLNELLIFIAFIALITRERTWKWVNSDYKQNFTKSG